MFSIAIRIVFMAAVHISFGLLGGFLGRWLGLRGF